MNTDRCTLFGISVRSQSQERTMSYFDEMIATERIPDSYAGWERYRREVTEYIENNCKVTKVSRQDDGSTKPVLALWGIGQAGDIDIGRLAKCYKLVLIDRDREAVLRAVRKYGLNEQDYIIADIPFWQVDDDQYRLYEAMLEDCVDAEHILEFLTGIATGNSGKYIGKTETGYIEGDRDRYLDIFDYSVAVGLHSQLNSRFAALLYHYRDNYHEEDLRLISSAISGLNEAAVERLNDYMYHMTKEIFIYGYEETACETQADAERLARAFDAGDVEVMKSVDHIEGVAQLMKDMSLHMDYDVELVSSRYMVWPFDTAGGRKNYVMGFAAMRKI